MGTLAGSFIENHCAFLDVAASTIGTRCEHGNSELAILEKAKHGASYRLDSTIITNSKSKEQASSDLQWFIVCDG